MKCRKCGEKLPEGVKFCLSCGERVNPAQDITLENNQYQKYVDAYTPQGESNGSSNASAQAIQKPSNEMAVAGFIVSFIWPLLGFIFSIIGLKRSPLQGRKGLAIAGIVIACINFVLGMFLRLFANEILDAIMNAFGELTEMFVLF